MPPEHAGHTLKRPGRGRVAGISGSPVRELLALTHSRPDVISLAGGLPAAELLDVAGISAVLQTGLCKSGPARLQYSATEGLPELRKQLADRMAAKGIRADPGAILVTSGAQQALALSAAALLEPGDTVLVEQPTYLAALQCFQLFGARVVGVPSGPTGIDLEALRSAIEQERPTMLYLVPTFANPTGWTLPSAARTSIAEITLSQGVWLVEDDPYSDLRFRGEPVGPVAAHTVNRANIIYCGSTSKVCAPGLRVGWMHGPEELIEAAAIAKQAIDLHSSTLDQGVVADYLATGELTNRLDTLRRLYRERRDAMLTELDTFDLPQDAHWTDPDGGMFVWLNLSGAIDTRTLLPDALAAGVAFVPGAPFYAQHPDTSTMRLSFTSHPPATLRAGMRRLRTVLKAAM